MDVNLRQFNNAKISHKDRHTLTWHGELFIIASWSLTEYDLGLTA